MEVTFTTPSTGMSASAIAANPQPYLTATDIQQFEFLAGTTTLADAMKDTNIREAANHQAYIRANGYWDANGFMPLAYLSASDAKLLESMTGTTNIMAAVEADPGVASLADMLGSDRYASAKYGTAMSGDGLSELRTQLAGEIQQVRMQGAQFGLAVPIATLQKAIEFLQVGEASGRTVSKTA